MMAAAALSLLAAASLPKAASADNYAWVLFGGTSLGDLDLSTTHGKDYSEVTLANGVVGLGELNSNADDLYGLSAAGALYGINGLTGAETYDGGGSSGITFIDFGSTINGLYAIATSGDLYSIGLNGSETDLGPTGLGTVTRNIGMGLSTGNSTLYFTNMVSSTVEDLYSVDTLTGALTLEGSIASGSKKTDILTVGGMAEIASELFAAANTGLGSHQSSWTITPGTPCSGQCTTTYNAEILPNNKHAVTGMAMGEASSAPLVPEPSEWALMLAGVGAVGGMMRLRRRSEVQA